MLAEGRWGEVPPGTLASCGDNPTRLMALRDYEGHPHRYCRTVVLAPMLTLPLTVGLVLVENASLPPQSSPR